MYLKKVSLTLILSQFLIGTPFFMKESIAIVPYYHLPAIKNLKQESLSIGKSAYQLLYFGQIKQSLNLAKLAISLNNKDEKLWAILAEAQMANQQNDKALKSIEKGQKINPKMSELYFAESSIYLIEKKYKKAKESIVEGLAIKPRNPSAIFQLGNIYLIEKKYKKAIETFNESLKLDKNFWQAINNKGLAYFELNKIELASNCFKKAISLEKNAESLLGLAVSFQYKDKNESIKLTKNALKIDPKYVSNSYREEQLWGSKIQKSTKELFKLKELKEDIDFAKQYLN